MKFVTTLFTFIGILLLAVSVLAGAPSLMTYQGILLDASGNPLASSTHNVTFKLFDEEALGTGTELWSQNFPALATDASGGFIAILSNLDQTDFADTSLWLEITVDPDGPMDPRQRLTAAPYAFSAGGSWSLTGNADLVSGVNFLGTLDDMPLIFKVNGTRACRIYPPRSDYVVGDESPSFIAGYEGNSTTDTADGVTISGGGYSYLSVDCKQMVTADFGTIGGGADNRVLAKFGTVGGGKSNKASGEYSTVPGGYDCVASADYSFAAGSSARAQHNGSFVWGDASGGAVGSTDENQFKIRASNGVLVGGGVDGILKIQDAGLNSNISLDGGTGEVNVGGSVDGSVRVMDASGKQAIYLNSTSRVIRMENVSEEQTIRIDGENGTLKMFASGSTSESIRLNAETGTVVTEVLKICSGCDVAEPFMMTDDAQFPEGAVVVIDEANPGRTTLSAQAYDTRVAGIISGAGNINPGLTLSQRGILDGGQNVALTGRVYCQATASNGAIRPGDMLTTSDIPGHAMKATDRNRAYGAVIGKAMTTLDDGEGLVLVLVNLQ